MSHLPEEFKDFLALSPIPRQISKFWLSQVAGRFRGTDECQSLGNPHKNHGQKLHQRLKRSCVWEGPLQSVPDIATKPALRVLVEGSQDVGLLV